jgi:hypothetical protein
MRKAFGAEMGQKMVAPLMSVSIIKETLHLANGDSSNDKNNFSPL